MKKKILMGMGSYIMDRIITILMGVTLLLNAIEDNSGLNVVFMVITLLCTAGSMSLNLLNNESEE